MSPGRKTAGPTGLTDAAIRQAVPGTTRQKLFDRDGLFLLIAPSGRRWWRLQYQWRRRRQTMSLGTYPLVTLKRAREKRDEARRLLDRGIDPRVAQQSAKTAGTVETIARAWLASRRHALTPATVGKVEYFLRDYIFPRLGPIPMADLDAPSILRLLKPLETKGRRETAHRIRQILSQIGRYAIAHGHATRDAAADLRGALSPVKTRHRPALTDPKAIGGLLRAIDAGGGTRVVDAALQLSPLVFLRPGELRKARWAEIDLDAALWRIPAERMKMREPHLVPLAPQAVEILKDLHEATGTGKLVFPSARTPQRPISNGTITAALRRLGYTRDQMTAHGFRTIATTLLNELGFPPDIIERQMAHREANAVRDAYNRAQYLDKRRDMMNRWADYLDSLRDQA